MRGLGDGNRRLGGAGLLPAIGVQLALEGKGHAAETSHDAEPDTTEDQGRERDARLRVGLRRAGFPREQIRQIKDMYRLLYRSGLKLSEALDRIGAELPGPLAEEMAAFIRSSNRGIVRERNQPGIGDDE